MSGRVDPQRLLLALAAPALALLVAVGLTSVVLAAAGNPVWSTYGLMTEYGTRPRSLALAVNTATTYYLSALAVAVGFRMGLFNIGVDGQYRVAAFMAALVGGAVTLPAPLHVAVIVIVAMVTGAAWAGIAAVLKATRGVSEVISTIMLNAIAGSLVAFLLRRYGEQEGNDIATATIAESGWVPGIPLVPGSSEAVYGSVVIAVVAGIGYSVLLNRTRFGFDLRATGRSQTAAVASGVDVKRMVVVAMLISGGIAGLVGMPVLLGQSHAYNLNFPAGLGFTGIAIALLGRNSPVGIALGALLFAFLENSAQILALNNISREIVTIMQGMTVLAVVIAYEVVRRVTIAREQQRVAADLARTAERRPEAVGA